MLWTPRRGRRGEMNWESGTDIFTLLCIKELTPSPGDLPDPGIEPGSPALQADALTSEPPVADSF